MYSARKLVWEMTLWLRLGICRAAAWREREPGPQPALADLDPRGQPPSRICEMGVAGWKPAHQD